MKCNKCNNEVDDKLLICPKCGNILKKEEKGYHHNYADKSLKLGAAKLTEEEVDPDYDLKKEKRSSLKPLFKSFLFWFVNIVVLISIVFLIVWIKEFFESIWYFFIPLALLVIISMFSYECLFYKAYNNPYYGLIPIYRLKVLFEVCNDEGSRSNSRKLMCIILAYVIWFLLSLSPMYMVWFIFFKEAFIIISLVSLIVYINMRVKVLGDLSMRFSSSETSRILTIIFPFAAIIVYGMNSKYTYTKLNDSYL